MPPLSRNPTKGYRPTSITGGTQHYQENYNPTACRTEPTDRSEPHLDQLVPSPWVMKAESTAGTYRISPRGSLLQG